LPEAARVKAAADIEEMRSMISSALRFARDELVEGTNVRVDLGSLLESLAEDMRDGGSDVSVVSGARAVVRGDPAALRRLFANLLENAVRYGERARVGWALDAGEVEVTVEDDGLGFNLARVEALFEPFVRGEASRNRATGGTGLGLAIVRSIVERHDGTVTLENGAIGAVVRLRLPLSG